MGDKLPFFYLNYGVACQTLGEFELTRMSYERATIDQYANYYPINYLSPFDKYEHKENEVDIDIDLYKHVFKLGPLFEDIDQRRLFHSELYKNVRIDDTFRMEVHPEAPYSKWLTGDLSVKAVNCFKEFENRIRLMVDKLKRELKPIHGHPFLGRIPNQYRVEFFGALLGPGGFHSPHVLSKA